MGNWSQGRGHRRSRHWVTGLILIGIGSLFLLDRLAYVDGISVGHFWPFIIALVGVGRIIDARHVAHVAKGLFMIFLAFWLYACMENLWGLSFQTSWPMILIALGLRHIIVGVVSKSEKQLEGNQP